MNDRVILAVPQAQQELLKSAKAWSEDDKAAMRRSLLESYGIASTEDGHILKERSYVN